MGNAPLPAPPVPTESRVVLPISTATGWFATRLLIHPEVGAAELTTEDDRTSRNSGPDPGPGRIDAHSPARQISDGNEAQVDTLGGNSSNCKQFPMPKQFLLRTRETGVPLAAPEDNGDGDVLGDNLGSTDDSLFIIPPREYQAKMQELQARLDDWKVARMTLAMLLFAMATNLVFFVLLAIPTGFNWQTSPLGEHPFYVLTIGVGLIAIFAGSYYYRRHQTAILIADVEDIFRCWRRRRPHEDGSTSLHVGAANAPTVCVHVTLKSVSHVDVVTPNARRRGDAVRVTVGRHGKSAKTVRVRNNCFSLVMNLVDLGHSDAGAISVDDVILRSAIRRAGSADTTEDDVISLGTCNTDNSDEGNSHLAGP